MLWSQIGYTADYAKPQIAPMSGPAIQGVACLGFATVVIIATYIIGPMEALMLVSGAQHVATGPITLFIPIMSILGGGSCALAATAMPSISWMLDQSENIIFNYVSADIGSDGTLLASIRPMSESEIQSTGCIVGAVAGFTASMLSSPMEVAMLASGATTIVSNTPLLGLGLLATTIASGCTIGSLTAVPIVAFLSNYGTMGDSFFAAIAQQFFGNNVEYVQTP
ncbi:hypothetical protein TI05_03150 [Achromatium sp. WMS3]|nr:hypothetical protein TI05_03150 [Achromatium sp. WMS3]